MAAHVGFSATTTRKPRQARKGATVAVMSGAGEAPAWAVSIRASEWADGLDEPDWYEKAGGVALVRFV
jgi:hypothetical protein